MNWPKRKANGQLESLCDSNDSKWFY